MCTYVCVRVKTHTHMHVHLLIKYTLYAHTIHIHAHTTHTYSYILNARIPQRVEVPTEFLHLYITNCIKKCRDIQDKSFQGRLVRLVRFAVQRIASPLNWVFPCLLFPSSCVYFSSHSWETRSLTSRRSWLRSKASVSNSARSKKRQPSTSFSSPLNQGVVRLLAMVQTFQSDQLPLTFYLITL